MVTIEKITGTSDSPEDFSYHFERLSPLEYYTLVKESINYNHIKDLECKLDGIELPPGVLITTVGSDGKLEQHMQSKTEMIVIQEEQDLNGDNLLRDFFGANNYREVFDTGDGGVIETKSFDSEVCFSYAFGDPSTVYPDRVLNAHPLYPITGEGLEVYFRSREKVLVEMSTEKRIKNQLKSQLRSYKRSMRTGEYRRVKTFDNDEGLQYYNEEWPEYTTGFKVPFLRSVQRKLDLFTINIGDIKSWNEVAREIPTNTLGRLDYLADLGVIPHHEALSVGEAYAWFLQQYHCVQERYKDSNREVAAPYDKRAFDTYRKDIERFANL